MTNPCSIGFLCPYRYYNGEGDPQCTYPYIRLFIGQEFPLAEEVDCKLIEQASDLESFIDIFDNASDTFRESFKKELERIWEDRRHLVEMIRNSRRETERMDKDADKE